MSEQSHLRLLLTGPAASLLDHVQLPDVIMGARGGAVSRAVIAAALNLDLLAGLLERVPSGRAYVEDLARKGQKLVFDHGAVRSVAMAGMGEMPLGQVAITRVLEPLGYAATHTYPMPRLNMTGRSYTHADFPEALPQFFVSELHAEQFSLAFQAAARRVTSNSTDPLTPEDQTLLTRLKAQHALSLEEARALLPRLVQCFTRRHGTPRFADYETLRAESAEMAWIATEGNAFNHATDRVSSLDDVVAAQRALGRRVKDRIEVSASGRVRQTAFHADPVTCEFLGEDGGILHRQVPGSFFEFIQRETLPGEAGLDLAFDTGNAQAIFKMTAA
jgi:2-oxoadipate dioxygenase/decarboxylase